MDIVAWIRHWDGDESDFGNMLAEPVIDGDTTPPADNHEWFACVLQQDAIAAIEQADQWRLAVDHLLSCWYSTSDSYASPHAAIKALIAFEVTAALDPKVSSDAAALVERGRREGREKCSKELCDERDAAVHKAAHREQMVEQIRADMREMHAQLQKMTAERDAWKNEAMLACEHQAIDNYQRLLNASVERDALKADAARYQRVRRMASRGELPREWTEGYTERELDTAVDAAKEGLG